MKNAGTILEPACLYVDQGKRELAQLAATVNLHKCRNAVIHSGDVRFLDGKLDRSRIAVVVDFPYGRSGNGMLKEIVQQISDFGIKNFDICVNLAQVLAGDLQAVMCDFQGVENTLNSAWISSREVKAIIQLPYLWQYAPDCIDPLMCMLAKTGVKVIKDWTTVHNFSKSVDVSLQARLDALDYVRRVIRLKQLSLKVKIAGGVRADNAVEFVRHGADILGVGVQFVPDVINALESV